MQKSCHNPWFCWKIWKLLSCLPINAQEVTVNLLKGMELLLFYKDWSLTVFRFSCADLSSHTITCITHCVYLRRLLVFLLFLLSLLSYSSYLIIVEFECVHHFTSDDQVLVWFTDWWTSIFVEHLAVQVIQTKSHVSNKRWYRASK